MNAWGMYVLPVSMDKHIVGLRGCVSLSLSGISRVCVRVWMVVGALPVCLRVVWVARTVVRVVHLVNTAPQSSASSNRANRNENLYPGIHIACVCR